MVPLFLQLGVMLLAAIVCGQAMRRLNQPAVLGELLGGIVLGPTVFGTLAPGAFARVFPPDAALGLARQSLLSVGMLFFLLVAGLEVKLTHLHRRRREVAFTSLLGLLVPMVLGIGSVHLFPALWGEGESRQGWVFGVFVGTALSISALPVIARILMDLGLLQRELGIIVMTAAALDDVIGWTLFAVILNVLAPAASAHAASGPTVLVHLGLLAAFVAAVVLLGRWLAQPVLDWVRAHLAWPTAFIGVTTVAMLGAAAVTESLGIHAVFGAYVVGIALGQTLDPAKASEAHDVIHRFALSFFAPLYFVSIGLRVNFARHFDLALVALVIAVACAGKIFGASLGARLAGMRSREALAVGFGMNARGAMEMILATVALESGLIDQRIFVALVVMALVTSMLGGPMMKRLIRAPVPATVPAVAA
jgi:Kef-type K+ transport system membrane component KefB